MQVRGFQTQSDVDQSIELRKYVFHSQYTTQKAKDYRCLLNMGQGIGAFDNDELKGQLINLPLTVNFYGQSLRAVGINHVGVYPEARGRGIATQLVRQSLMEAHRLGQVVAILQPFAPSFYRQFGYELYTQRLHYEIPVERYPNFPIDRVYTVARKQPAELTGDQIDAIQALYTQEVHQTHGMPFRDAPWWQRQAAQYPDLNYALLYLHSSVVAYLSYRKVDTTIEVVDLIAAENHWRQQLLGFLAAHQSNVFKIVGMSTTAKALSFDFDDPRIEQYIYQDTMARIVDIPAFFQFWLSAFPIQQSIQFSVKDESAPWNSGTYTLNAQGVDYTAEITQELVSPQTLAAIFLSFLTTAQLDKLFDATQKRCVHDLIELTGGKQNAHFITEF